ncbi:hypothetical protein LR48_Vigan07g178500 [Vigna angularis]|uniref:Uncharacterized protein n=1 Tax=Phaseolus angularis TaxID=3914 RepID=A0A0L9UZF7_PHAAN|nr:hypothetical protein LR48_Vigan07g178500 [Vigna angularis]
MASSLGKRIKTIGSKRKDKEPERSYSSKFLSRKNERHINIVQYKRLLIERNAGLKPDFAPQFGEQLENKNWGRLATYPTPPNIAVVKEVYTNARRLGDHSTEEYMIYVRGHTIRKALLLYCVMRGMNINIGQMRDMYMSLIDAKMQSIHRGQVATTEMIIGMYDAPPGHRWTMDEFNNVVACLEDQAQANGAGVAEAPAIDNDKEGDDEFEDAEDEGEEEDLDDSMG